jgi:hypothetical protein
MSNSVLKQCHIVFVMPDRLAQKAAVLTLSRTHDDRIRDDNQASGRYRDFGMARLVSAAEPNHRKPALPTARRTPHLVGNCRFNMRHVSRQAAVNFGTSWVA